MAKIDINKLKGSLRNFLSDSFIYLISFAPLNRRKKYAYPPGTIYVGKKAFTHSKRVKLSKRAKLLPANKGKKILKSTTDSGWKDYYGSSADLTAFIAEVGKENFTREILTFTGSKTENTYEELKAQIEYRVLEVPSFNKWISGKVYRHQLEKLKTKS